MRVCKYCATRISTQWFSGFWFADAAWEFNGLERNLCRWWSLKIKILNLIGCFSFDLKAKGQLLFLTGCRMVSAFFRKLAAIFGNFQQVTNACSNFSESCYNLQDVFRIFWFPRCTNFKKSNFVSPGSSDSPKPSLTMMPKMKSRKIFLMFSIHARIDTNFNIQENLKRAKTFYFNKAAWNDQQMIAAKCDIGQSTLDVIE